MKSNIKSKKEKNIQKKFSKGNTPHLIDLVQSSSQSLIQVQKIQKRNKYSGKSFNNSTNSSSQEFKTQPNMLNIQKLKKSIIDNKFLAKITLNNYQERQQANSYNKKQGQKQINNNNPDSLLVVESSFDQPEVAYQDRSLFSYRVEGKQGIKYISQSHFKGRVNSQIKDLQLKQLKKIHQQEEQLERIMQGEYPSSDQDKKLQQAKKPQQRQRKRAARYFEQQNSDQDEQQNTNIVKCFRCNKKGHIAKHCMEQQPRIQCNFCLGQHHHTLCDTSPCFKCCQFGHISQDCSSKGIQCRKCHKRGHRGQNCGTYSYLDYHHRTEDQIKKRFNINDLRNLKCINNTCKNKSGHFNCFSYSNHKNSLPYEDKTEKRNNYYNNKNQQQYQRQYKRQKQYRSSFNNSYSQNNRQQNYYQNNRR